MQSKKEPSELTLTSPEQQFRVRNQFLAGFIFPVYNLVRRLPVPGVILGRREPVFWIPVLPCRLGWLRLVRPPAAGAASWQHLAQFRSERVLLP